MYSAYDYLPYYGSLTKQSSLNSMTYILREILQHYPRKKQKPFYIHANADISFGDIPCPLCPPYLNFTRKYSDLVTYLHARCPFIFRDRLHNIFLYKALPLNTLTLHPGVNFLPRNRASLILISAWLWNSVCTSFSIRMLGIERYFQHQDILREWKFLVRPKDK